MSAQSCGPRSKRLPAKHGYPPDQQPAALKLVMEQMESMAPRYAQRREAS
jgi:type I restriction enzyme R subunit